jgi:hypothetical protein
MHSADSAAFGAGYEPKADGLEDVIRQAELRVERCKRAAERGEVPELLVWRGLGATAWATECEGGGSK